MGDIAKAAGLSRQSLYARFSNKDEVYAAGLELFATRLLDTLADRWAHTGDMSDKLDQLAEIAIYPTYDLLNSNPNAADLVEGAQTPEGKAAMQAVTARKVAFYAKAFAPYQAQLAQRGLTPEQVATFLEVSKEAILKAAQSPEDLALRFAPLKAAVLALIADA